MFFKYWEQVDQMVFEVRIPLFWETIWSQNGGTLFLRSSPWSISAAILIMDHKNAIQFTNKIFQIQAPCKCIERKIKGRKKKCQVSSQSANSFSWLSLSTSCNPIKFNSAQVFTRMTNTKAYFPSGLLKN